MPSSRYWVDYPRSPPGLTGIASCSRPGRSPVAAPAGPMGLALGRGRARTRRDRPVDLPGVAARDTGRRAIGGHSRTVGAGVFGRIADPTILGRHPEPGRRPIGRGSPIELGDGLGLSPSPGPGPPIRTRRLPGTARLMSRSGGSLEMPRTIPCQPVHCGASSWRNSSTPGY